MTLRSLAERVRGIVSGTLLGEEPETPHLLVAGALVVREGDHYRIETGAETLEELERCAALAEGRCDCGAPLSRGSARAECRTCGREFRI